MSTAVMVKEVASRAHELIAMELETRSKHSLGPIQNFKLSNEVRGAMDLAYAMTRADDDPEEMPIAEFIRARDLALGIA